MRSDARSAGRRARLMVVGLFGAVVLFGTPGLAAAQPCVDYSGSLSWLGEAQFWGNWQFWPPPKALLAKGDTLIAFDDYARLNIMDASDPAAIRTLCQWPCDDDGLRGADIARRGDYVYGAGYGAVIGVVSIADPTAPRYVGSFPSLLPSAFVAMCVSGDLLLQIAEDGLQTVDVSQPDQPAARGVVSFAHAAHDVACLGDLALVATDGGLAFVDVANLEQPAIVGLMTSLGRVQAVTVAGSLAYASASGEPAGIKVIDVSDPQAPQVVGELAGVAGHEIAVGEGFACVSGVPGMAVCDVLDPQRPRLLGRICPAWFGGALIRQGRACVVQISMSFPGLSALKMVRLGRQETVVPVRCELTSGSPFGRDIAVSGRHAYVALSGYPHDILSVVDIGDPSAPVAVGQLAVPAGFLSVSGHHLFAVHRTFEVFDIAVPAQPTPVASLPLGLATGYEVNGVQRLGDLVLIHCRPPYQQPPVSLVVDVSAPDAPRIAGLLPARSSGKELLVAGSIAVGATSDSLFVFGVSDPLQPDPIGAAALGDYIHVWPELLAGHYAYLAAETPACERRLLVFDIHDPSRPSLAATLPMPCLAPALRVGDTVYLADFESGIHLLDIEDPGAPVYSGTISWEAGHSCLAVAGDRLLSCFWNDLAVFPLDCSSTVPVYLASLEVTPGDGAVEVTWSVTGDGPCEFRLTARSRNETWPVAVASRPDGEHVGRDVSPRLAAGGLVTYTLELRDPGRDAWTVLGSRTVALSAPARPLTLLEPSPNPCNPAVAIRFVLDAPQRAKVAIYDPAGRRVVELADGFFPAGRQELVWRGVDASGAPVASGTYVLRVAGERGSDRRKITLVR